LSVGTPAAFTAVTSELLQGQSIATYAFGTGTSEVAVSANRPGTFGNLISVALVDDATPGVVVTPGTITGESEVAQAIEVKYRGPANGNVDDANAVAALLNTAASDQKFLVTAVGGGAGNVTPSGYMNLSGGTGTGLKVYVGGIEQPVNAVLTDALLSGYFLTATGMANTDMGSIYLVSNGVQSMPQTVNLVT
jgi:hypothetical protein